MRAIKHAANIITGLRMVGALVILATEPLSPVFIILYSVCGLSDLLDGSVARLTHSQSRAGARLDSIADITLLCCVAVRLSASLAAICPQWCLYAAGMVAAVRLTALAVGAMRFHRLTAFHTISGKLTGLTLFLLPYLMNRTLFAGYLVVLCAVAGYSAMEELLCACLIRAYDPDIPGVCSVFPRRSEQR